MSTGLTFLNQRQCSYQHIPLFHCLLNSLHPLHTVSTLYCIHWFDLFPPKTMSPSPYTTIPLCSLCTASTASTVSTAYYIHCIHWVLRPLHTASTGLTFLDQRQCPHHHIPLFHCIHHIHYIHWFDLFAPKTMSPPPYTTIPLHPLVWCFCTKDNVPTTIYYY